jgi:hypothetical protein
VGVWIDKTRTQAQTSRVNRADGLLPNRPGHDSDPTVCHSHIGLEGRFSGAIHYSTVFDQNV